MKKRGLLYLSVPNMARIQNRIKLILGKSIRDSIDDYFDQLDKGKNMIVGLHWREYTDVEIRVMLEKLGFEIIRSKFRQYSTVIRRKVRICLVINRLKRVVPRKRVIIFVPL